MPASWKPRSNKGYIGTLEEQDITPWTRDQLTSCFSILYTQRNTILSHSVWLNTPASLLSFSHLLFILETDPFEYIYNKESCFKNRFKKQQVACNLFNQYFFYIVTWDNGNNTFSFNAFSSTIVFFRIPFNKISIQTCCSFSNFEHCRVLSCLLWYVLYVQWRSGYECYLVNVFYECMDVLLWLRLCTF